MASVSTLATTITSGGVNVLNEGQTANLSNPSFSVIQVVNFNSRTVGSTSGFTEGIATYSAPNNFIFQAPLISGVSAPPPGDTSPYASVGNASPNRNPLTITFSQSLSYFGFYVGSVDRYNSIEFYNGNTLVETVTGTTIAAAIPTSANGNQSVGAYVNIFNVPSFNKLKMISTSNAFETDNHAFGIERGTPTSETVPEPTALLTLVPAIAWLYFKRKR